MSKPKSLPWFKYRVANLGQDLDAMPPAHEGICMRLARRIWVRGPQTADELRPWAFGLWEEVSGYFVAAGDGLSLPWLEEARTEAGGLSAQRAVAGQASATQRKLNSRKRKLNGRSTSVNGSSTDVISLSPSISSSPSLSESGGGAGGTDEPPDEPPDEVPWPTFDDWWNLYDKKTDRKKCEPKWLALPHQTRVAMMEHTRLYVSIGRGSESQFRRDPATYLNNENWNDKELASPRTNSVPPKPAPAPVKLGWNTPTGE